MVNGWMLSLFGTVLCLTLHSSFSFSISRKGGTIKSLFTRHIHKLEVEYEQFSNGIPDGRFNLEQHYWTTPSHIKMEVLYSSASRKLPLLLNNTDYSQNISLQIDETDRLTKNPLLFVHGSFHSAWCFAERFMPYFSQLGHECYAISLRGTAASGTPQNSKHISSVKVEDHVEDLKYCIDSIVKKQIAAGVYKNHPILIGHSSGGIIVMKLIEQDEIRRKIAGVALLCSVPPSGYFPMIKRGMRNNFFQALQIFWGFVMKQSTRSIALCRRLFFDETVTNDEIERYLKRFQADSLIGLNLKDLQKKSPSLTSMDLITGRAVWLANISSSDVSKGIGEPLLIFNNRTNAESDQIPARLVLGAEKDYLTDREAVIETAKYLGIGQGPLFISGLYHDVMLGSKWRQAAELLSQWINEAIPQ